jgi:hypothetical protein
MTTLAASWKNPRNSGTCAIMSPILRGSPWGEMGYSGGWKTGRYVVA